MRLRAKSVRRPPVSFFANEGREGHLVCQGTFFGRSWRKRDAVDPDPIDVGKQTITALPLSNLSSPDSRAMIRDGHIAIALIAITDSLGGGRSSRCTVAPGLPRDGFTRGDLKALPVQTAIHAGMPAANTAFAEAGRIIAAPDEPAACPTDTAGTATRIADPRLRR